jgi:hypothetical protein
MELESKKYTPVKNTTNNMAIIKSHFPIFRNIIPCFGKCLRMTPTSNLKSFYLS